MAEDKKSRGYLKVSPPKPERDGPARLNDLKELGQYQAARPTSRPQQAQPQRPFRSTDVQDDFLRHLVDEGCPLVVLCVDGYKPAGRLVAFDTYGLVMDDGEGEELLFKHAVISIKRSRG